MRVEQRRLEERHVVVSMASQNGPDRSLITLLLDGQRALSFRSS
jgi:hypothetical protein